MSAKKSPKKKKSCPVPFPPATDWRTTDQDEINRRIQRARDEKHSVSNLHPENPIYSIVDFLDPSLLGPLFRFNREFYQFDEKGRPSEY